jgi:hypothetical protein
MPSNFGFMSYTVKVYVVDKVSIKAIALWRVARARVRRVSCLATKLLSLIPRYSLSTLTDTLVTA